MLNRTAFVMTGIMALFTQKSGATENILLTVSPNFLCRIYEQNRDVVFIKLGPETARKEIELNDHVHTLALERTSSGVQAEISNYSDDEPVFVSGSSANLKIKIKDPDLYTVCDPL